MTGSAPVPKRRLAWLSLLLVALAGAWALRSGAIAVPEAWNPWAPLRIDAPPNLLTGLKLSRASADPAACRAALAQADMALVPVDDRRTGTGCGFANAVRIERSSVAVGEPFTLSCRAALSLAMWERHALQQAARTHLGAGVQRIEHLGSYACRNLYGEDGRRRSQHATADALDIAGFVLDNGRRVRVLGGWASPDGASAGAASTDRVEAAGRARAALTSGADPDAAEAAFLRAVHDGACRYFDAVLGPDYNRAHADHFHFDRGRARVCR
ncbi:extensin-like domain-containing protein [Cognatilysobacter tabacisoli]|uniref:extensin-like domain-containing protein n=1 Tax=Cognatilysobacter tabacisoli TaxID=2315424 RepID=UPI000E6B14C6|nr:extensin family protein [Lysobacter tabacisoli]